MKTTKAILAVLAGVAILAACGRPSTDNRFTFDGSGDPHYPEGNVVHGKFAGTMEVLDFKSPIPSYRFFNNPPNYVDDIFFVDGLFAAGAIEGLGGLPVFGISMPPPPRKPVAEPSFPCYYDLGIAAQFGTLTSLDVGPSFQADLVGLGQAADIARQPDAPAGPGSDVLFYENGYLNGATFGDQDIAVTWPGGTLAGLGYAHAPLRANNQVVIRQPPPVALPGTSTPGVMVNGSAMTASPIPTASSYVISWQPWVDADPADTYEGMEIIAQIYGPADLTPTGGAPYAEDTPMITKLGQIVCIADDPSGTFTIQQAWLDELLARVMDTTAYASSTEDVNHDGVLAPRTGSMTTGFSGEDANGNGTIDKIYGTALFVTRRTENQFIACLKGADENSNCSRSGNMFISGNDMNYGKMAFAMP